MSRKTNKLRARLASERARHDARELRSVAHAAKQERRICDLLSEIATLRQEVEKLKMPPAVIVALRNDFPGPMGPQRVMQIVIDEWWLRRRMVYVSRDNFSVGGELLSVIIPQITDSVRKLLDEFMPQPPNWAC